MPVFAITGAFCSGKTTVLEILEGKGAIIYNIDEVVHSYYKDRNSEVYKKIAQVFPQVLNKNKTISRRKLREIVFTQPRSLQKLESIVHPWGIQDLRRWVKEAKRTKGIHIAEVPLLFQKGLEGLFDKVIFVYVPKDVLIRRITRKFRIPIAEARKRLAVFGSKEDKVGKSDFVIHNNVTKKKLKKKVDVLWEELITFS